MWINNRIFGRKLQNIEFNPFHIQVLVHKYYGRTISLLFFFSFYIIVGRSVDRCYCCCCCCPIQTISYSLWVFAYDTTCIWVSNYEASIFDAEADNIWNFSIRCHVQTKPKKKKKTHKKKMEKNAKMPISIRLLTVMIPHSLTHKNMFEGNFFNHEMIFRKGNSIKKHIHFIFHVLYLNLIRPRNVLVFSDKYNADYWFFSEKMSNPQNWLKKSSCLMQTWDFYVLSFYI